MHNLGVRTIPLDSTGILRSGSVIASCESPSRGIRSPAGAHTTQTARWQSEQNPVASYLEVFVWILYGQVVSLSQILHPIGFEKSTSAMSKRGILVTGVGYAGFTLTPLIAMK